MVGRFEIPSQASQAKAKWRPRLEKFSFFLRMAIRSAGRLSSAAWPDFSGFLLTTRQGKSYQADASVALLSGTCQVFGW